MQLLFLISHQLKSLESTGIIESKTFSIDGSLKKISHLVLVIHLKNLPA
jgi:GTP-sensing pleiotropic transcriptional regulator CodY